MSGIVGNNTNRSSGLIKTAAVGADSITGDEIADDAIDSEHYTDGSIDSGHLAGSIDATKLADGTVTSTELQYINSLSSNAQTQITAAGLSLGHADKCKVVTTTYDLSTASGNKDITGFGFDPKVIITLYSVSGTDDWGWGFMSVTQGLGYCLRTTGGAVGLFDISGNLLTHQVTTSASQVGSLSTLTDGVRIAFTKNGSPTGTLNIKIIGFS